MNLFQDLINKGPHYISKEEKQYNLTFGKKYLNMLEKLKKKNDNSDTLSLNFKSQIKLWLESLSIDERAIVLSIENDWLIGLLSTMYMKSKNENDIVSTYSIDFGHSNYNQREKILKRKTFYKNKFSSGIENCNIHSLSQKLVYYILNVDITDSTKDTLPSYIDVSEETCYYTSTGLNSTIKKCVNSNSVSVKNNKNNNLISLNPTRSLKGFLGFQKRDLEDLDSLLKLFEIMSEGDFLTKEISISLDNNTKCYIFNTPIWFKTDESNHLGKWITAYMEQSIYVKYFLANISEDFKNVIKYPLNLPINTKSNHVCLHSSAIEILETWKLEEDLKIFMQTYDFNQLDFKHIKETVSKTKEFSDLMQIQRQRFYDNPTHTYYISNCYDNIDTFPNEIRRIYLNHNKNQFINFLFEVNFDNYQTAAELTSREIIKILQKDFRNQLSNELILDFEESKEKVIKKEKRKNKKPKVKGDKSDEESRNTNILVNNEVKVVESIDKVKEEMKEDIKEEVKIENKNQKKKKEKKSQFHLFSTSNQKRKEEKNDKTIDKQLENLVINEVIKEPPKVEAKHEIIHEAQIEIKEEIRSDLIEEKDNVIREQLFLENGINTLRKINSSSGNQNFIKHFNFKTSSISNNVSITTDQSLAKTDTYFNHNENNTSNQIFNFNSKAFIPPNHNSFTFKNSTNLLKNNLNPTYNMNMVYPQPIQYNIFNKGIFQNNSFNNLTPPNLFLINPQILNNYNETLFMNRLSKDIIDFKTRVEQNTKTLNIIKGYLFEEIQSILKNNDLDIRNNINISTFGSYSTNLSIECSDVDILITYNSQICYENGKTQGKFLSNDILFKSIISLLKNTNLFSLINPILTASVPLIKLKCNTENISKLVLKEKKDTDGDLFEKIQSSIAYLDFPFDKNEFNEIKLDLTFINLFGTNSDNDYENEKDSKLYTQKTITFINSACEVHSELKSLILIIKRLLTETNLNSYYNGGLSSYCLFYLVYSYVKVQKSSNIVYMLLDLFELFGKKFDYYRNIIDCTKTL